MFTIAVILLTNEFKVFLFKNAATANGLFKNVTTMLQQRYNNVTRTRTTVTITITNKNNNNNNNSNN
jgi:hypothetical protein